MVAEIDKRNNRVVLSLGGNVGDVKQTLLNSIKCLENEIGNLFIFSSIYQTKAWGVKNQPDFLNQVVIIDTNLSADQILNTCLSIEFKMGRVRTENQKWTERVVDIDVLFYGNQIIKTAKLTIPHRYIQERNFVLFPLAEIIPDFIHPVLGETIRELKKKCSDHLEVIKCLD